MALVNCPECHKQISDKAFSCPNCGFPISISNNMNSDSLNHTFIIILKNCFGKYKFDTSEYLEKWISVESAESWDIVSNTPCILKKNVHQDEADRVKSELEAIGAEVAIEVYEENQDEALLLQKYKSDELRCPRCGSTVITTGQRGFSIVSGFLGSSKTVNRCAKCGYNWQPKVK